MLSKFEEFVGVKVELDIFRRMSFEILSVFERLKEATIVSDASHKFSGAIFGKTLEGKQVIINFERRPGGDFQELQICIAGRPTVYVRKMLYITQIEAYSGEEGTMNSDDSKKLFYEYLQILKFVTPDRVQATKAKDLRNIGTSDKYSFV